MKISRFKRLQFDFSNEAVKELDKLMKKTGALNRAEVVKNALVLFKKHIEELEDVTNVMDQQMNESPWTGKIKGDE